MAVPVERPIQRSRWVPSVVIGLALAVLGGTLTWSALDLRGRIQSQIVEREGEILDAVTMMQHRNDKDSGETIAPLDDPGEQVELASKVSKLRDVLGVRLYSADGSFVNAFPGNITDTALAPSDLAQLRNLRPVSYFSAKARMQEQDLLAETNSATEPLLVVDVPLRTDDNQHLAGVIQFLIYGNSIARQYADLDRNLALKFSAWFVVAAGILMAGLGLALRRVQRANQGTGRAHQQPFAGQSRIGAGRAHVGGGRGGIAFDSWAEKSIERAAPFRPRPQRENEQWFRHGMAHGPEHDATDGRIDQSGGAGVAGTTKRSGV